MPNDAKTIAQALACGRPNCPCRGTAERGRGNTHCPSHEDRSPSLSLKQDGDRVLFHCKSSCSQESVIVALNQRGLWEEKARMSSSPRKSRGPKVTRYEIRDASGRLVASHQRTDKPDGSKTFAWFQGDGTSGLNGVPVSALPMYGSEKLASLPVGVTITVTEGEKAREALVARDIPAVGTVTGAASTPRPESLSALLPFRVCLWPDNDDPGRSHMVRIAEALWGLGHRDIRLVDWSGAPERGDAADFSGDGDELQELFKNASPYKPIAAVDLGCLLDDLCGFIRRYVVLGEHEKVVEALWVAHTHALDAAEVTPYLFVNSVEKRSGKTRNLEVVSLVVSKPWLTGRVTAAVLVRKLAATTPTVLLDESDAAFKGDKEYAETLRAVLNLGYRRGGVASLCVKTGGDYELRDFPVFGPKAIAGIGNIPDTVKDRSITISLKRRTANESVERFRWREVKVVAAPLVERLERWAALATQNLEAARPEIPEELDDRAAEAWEPLLAIADAAGGQWPQKARDAAKALSSGEQREDNSLGIRLLQDIQECLKSPGMTSMDLVQSLLLLEEAPWGDLYGKPLDARRLARLLRPYGVRPHTVRDGDKTFKGYERSDFGDAWVRYISPEKPSQPSQPSQNGLPKALEGVLVTDVTDVTVPGRVHADYGEV